VWIAGERGIVPAGLRIIAFIYEIAAGFLLESQGAEKQ
jgi:hypothetical protein